MHTQPQRNNAYRRVGKLQEQRFHNWDHSLFPSMQFTCERLVSSLYQKNFPATSHFSFPPASKWFLAQLPSFFYSHANLLLNLVWVTTTARKNTVSSTFERTLVNLWHVIWKCSHLFSALIGHSVTDRLGEMRNQQFCQIILFLGFHFSKSRYINCHGKLLHCHSETDKNKFHIHYIILSASTLIFFYHRFSLLFYREEDISVTITSYVKLL